MFRCKHCVASTSSSLDVARVAGWRFFTGKSQTGKDLDDTVCPSCAGFPKTPETGWRVGCHTCDWVWQDEYNEGPLAPKEAKGMANDHECEPDVWIAPPSGDRKFQSYEVNDDGSLSAYARQAVTA
jgi:hypothetical protein